jgi:MFS family permease
MKGVLAGYRNIASVAVARRLIGADAISKAGDWILYVAISTLVYRAGGAGALAVFSALRIAIPFAFGPWAGKWGARFAARSVMVFADIARALLLLLAAAAAYTNQSVWILQALVVGCAALTAAHAPAERRFQRDAIDEERRASFNAVLGAVGSTVIVIAPAVGGLTIVAVGNVGALLLDALSFVISAVLVLTVSSGPASNPAPAKSDVPEPDQRSRQAEGALVTALRAWRGDRFVTASLLTQAVACTIAGSCLVLLPLLENRLGAGHGIVGWLTAALGIGSVLGGLLGGAVARRERLVPAVGSIVLMGAVLGLLGGSSHLVAALVWSFLAGLLANIPEPLYWTTYASRVDEGDSSAFYGLVESAITGGFAVGGLLLGALAASLGGPAASWWIGGIGSVVAATAFVPALRRHSDGGTVVAPVSDTLSRATS